MAPKCATPTSRHTLGPPPPDADAERTADAAAADDLAQDAQTLWLRMLVGH